MNATSSMRTKSITFPLVVLLATSYGFGQITNVTNDTSTPIPGVGHDYIKMLSETVNPANGSVSIRIRVPVPPGRRLTIPFSFAYDSNGAEHVVDGYPGQGAIWVSNTSFLSQGGWSYAVPMVSEVLQTQKKKDPGFPDWTCNSYNNYIFQDPIGGRHALYLAYVVPGQSGCAQLSFPPSSYTSGGDDYFQAALSNPVGILPQVTLTDSDGTVYKFSNSNAYSTSSGLNGWGSLPDTIEDRNGNVVTLQQNITARTISIT